MPLVLKSTEAGLRQLSYLYIVSQGRCPLRERLPNGTGRPLARPHRLRERGSPLSSVAVAGRR